MSADDGDAQAAIAHAVQRARYNEAVVVTVNDDASNSPREIVLVACLDQENGGIIWQDAAAAIDSSSSTADDPGIVRHLRTKRWVLPMLNDHRRNHLYDEAVRKACQQLVKRRCNEDGNATIRILDIGSGTGLLAMMGAKHSINAIKEEQETSEKMKVQVTSVEMASAMARLARKTINENDLSENIVVVEKHSADVDFGIDDARFEEEECRKAKGVAVVAAGDDNTTCNDKADICTSELLESGLLGEGILPSIRDAWRRHLKPDAIVVPRRARVFAVLIEGMPLKAGGIEETRVNAATAFYGPNLHSFMKASGGVWLSTTIAPAGDESVAICSSIKNGDVLLGTAKDGGGGVGGITVPIHANAMLDENYRGKSANLTHEDGYNGFRGIHPLSDPTMVLDFDFASGLHALPPPSGRSVTTTFTPTADGECHGVLFWWELDLWDGEYDACAYSTEPIGLVKQTNDVQNGKTSGDKKTLWQDHWQQCLFFFGDGHLTRNEVSRKLTKGSPVEVVTYHDDSSISFSVKTCNPYPASADEGCHQSKEDTPASRPSQRRRLDEENDESVQQSLLNHHITTSRALQLNDSSRIETLRKSILHCMNVKGRDAPLLDISDTGICALVASLAGATKVTSLESSSGTMPTLAATVAQIGNRLPREGAQFQVIQALAEHISEEHIIGGAAEIVVAEPYYAMLEGWHLQEALNYFYLVRALKKRGVISPSALSVPAYAKIMSCVVEFDDFFSAYGKVDDVAGFCHASVNSYGDRYHTYDVSLPLWQYRYKRLSEVVCVANISYEGAAPTIESLGGPLSGVSYELLSEGFAQAAVFWVDYACRVGDGERFDIISTAKPSHRQIVRKLDKPIVITEADLIAGAVFHCRASFGDDPSGIEGHSFTFKYCG